MLHDSDSERSRKRSMRELKGRFFGVCSESGDREELQRIVEELGEFKLKIDKENKDLDIAQWFSEPFEQEDVEEFVH